MTRRPTISDVATRAGVSTATVSRVLNGGHWVRQDKVDAVNRAVRETGFVANRSARSLRTGRTATVGLLLDSTTQGLFSDPTFARLVTETSQALATHDHSLVLLVAGNEHDAKRALRVVRNRTLDGVIMAGDRGDGALLERVAASGIPLVHCGHPGQHEGTIPSVHSDDEQGGRLAAHALLERGCRRLALVAPPTVQGCEAPRVRGFVEAAGDALVPGAIEHGDFSRGSGTVAALRLVERHPEVDGLFASSDLMAAGALEALARLGRRVPQDIALVGYDDNPVAETTDPPLTTVRQSFDLIAKALVETLDERLNGREATSRVVPVELVRRASA